MRGWLAALMLALLAGCGARPPVAQEAFVFGTRVELVVRDDDEARAREALAEVLREFDRLHRAYHAWQPSELSALNEAIAAGKPHRVSPELAELILVAQDYARRSDYLFDPGIGRLVALWGFHADEFAPQLPDETALAALVRERPSIAKLKVNGLIVASADTVTALDFGGYLKGVALDRAAAILKRHGIAHALINIGGNVMALGRRGDRPWRVGIQHPREAGPLAILDLHDGEAIGTSGDYQRYFEHHGKRYCHLIDPRSGRPAEGTQALTVLIPPAGDAGLRSDVLTKPLFIAGDDWPRLAEKLGVTQALRVAADGRLEATAALLARLTFPDSSAASRVAVVPLPRQSPEK